MSMSALGMHGKLPLSKMLYKYKDEPGIAMQQNQVYMQNSQTSSSALSIGRAMMNVNRLKYGASETAANSGVQN